MRCDTCGRDKRSTIPSEAEKQIGPEWCNAGGTMVRGHWEAECFRIANVRQSARVHQLEEKLVDAAAVSEREAEALRQGADVLVTENARLVAANTRLQGELKNERIDHAAAEKHNDELIRKYARVESENTRLHTGEGHAGCDVQTCEIAAVASDESSAVAEAIAENTPLIARVTALEFALRKHGCHTRDCEAYRSIGRFGSASGLFWNEAEDEARCTCTLGAALRGKPAVDGTTSDNTAIRQLERREYSVGLDPSQPGGVRIEEERPIDRKADAEERDRG